MKINYREIKSFFYSQYFSDGLRMTTGILLPSLIALQFNHFDVGLTLSLGALCICTIDTPGPLMHKRNAMAIGNLFLFAVAVITGFARLNVFTLGLEVTLLSFLFSMFTIYGNRAASVGTSALLVMIFMMDKAEKPEEVLGYSAIILLGGIWYMLFSLVFFGIRPYRAAQQTLGENIADIADFLRIKADFYLPDTDIDENYRKLVSQQIKVSQHQDAVRELLFKSRVMVKESTSASRILLLTFVDLVDMFEQIMATHYDYSHIRSKYKDTGVLNEIAIVLQHMAEEMDNISFMVISNTRNKFKGDFIEELEQLKSRIDALGKNEQGTSNLALKKILINLRDLNDRIKSIYKYYNSKYSETLMGGVYDEEYAKFVTHQDYAPHIFFDNFSFSSTAFKHALRVSLVCLVGFILAKTIANGHHSYWILLTIIVILKPGFSLSKQRNYQRLIGTVIGGIAGIIILRFIPNRDTQFILLIIFMIGTYSFTRLNYVVSVLFMTPYVLILFKFLGVGLLVREREIDTLIGSTIAFIASYLLFPSWEYDNIQDRLKDVIYANLNYLVKIAESITGIEVGTIEYKLARKDVFVKSANLSASFERMTSEPKRRQKNVKDVHKFVVLNHILSSYIATVASTISGKKKYQNQAEDIKLIKKSIAVLNDTSEKLGGKLIDFKRGKPAPASTPALPLTQHDDILLKEQLGFINRISVDIARVTESIVGS
ncbi:FUSC family membrane protein [Mucilaginibacter gotjawali]|uniref:Inner membrane protein YccS n=2 Tax=Mucilaginibacter gotjawali TaxID=1550579 RepID=A0A0X8X3F4_9SPHI|nr:FUSC family membrane protein [Mucilaginibacter gotjawali]MBB3056290.1 putative membrane protein (TIGR01666 family) [Mucilaginibacter gotjawali]BAU54994.1 Inner membrane protein YccS [Mucilaginibacter gotjawali]